MTGVEVRNNESLDSAIKRFKRGCARAGIQQELKKREYYIKPSERRKRKAELARKNRFNLY